MLQRGLVILGFFASTLFGHSIEGSWVAPKNEHHPRMIIQMKTNHHITFGQVTWVDPQDHRFGTPAKCRYCQKPRSQSLKDMVLLWRFRQAPDQPNLWTYGQVLNPSDGKTYMGSIHVSPDDQSLSLQVFWGLPMFGKTFQWSRWQGSNALSQHLDHHGRNTYDIQTTLSQYHRRSSCLQLAFRTSFS